MFTKACFDELGGKRLLDTKGSEVFTKQKFAWDCLKLWDQADTQKIFNLCTAFFSSLLSARLCKWHEMEILSQTCLWISWHNSGIVETIRKSVEDKSFATKKLEQKEEHQGILHKKLLHLPNESRGFVAYLCYLSIVATVTKKRNSSFILMKSSRCHTARRANIPSKQREKLRWTFCTARGRRAGKPLGIEAPSL